MRGDIAGRRFHAPTGIYADWIERSWMKKKKKKAAHLPANHNRKRIMYTKKKRLSKGNNENEIKKTLLVALLTGRS